MSVPRWSCLALMVWAVVPWLAFAEKEEDRILNLFLSEFVQLTPGKGKFPASFTMGSTFKEAPATEKPPVRIRFEKPFAFAKYEVTQELWSLVMGKNPSRWRGKRNSAEMMSWDEANSFCEKVTGLLRTKGLLKETELIRLPSEAEWEYACRAGTTTKYSFADDARDLGAYAWFLGNSKGEDPPVGRKKPNAWGLYDMHGYIWEWCADTWSDTHEGAASNGAPRRSKDNDARVLRGGSWADPADSARCAFRLKAARTARSDRIGFRCVKAEIEKKEKP